MNIEKINTLGKLKKAGYESKSIKDELRDNLIENIKNKVTTFEGIHGYENTVIPELERAILSRHNINVVIGICKWDYAAKQKHVWHV